MTTSTLGVFADGVVGRTVVQHLLQFYPEALKVVVMLDRDSDVRHVLANSGTHSPLLLEEHELYAPETISTLRALDLDYIVLAWWPKIIKKEIIALPRIGVANFHPSLLPHNRGKHYNFWTLVEGTPFGVSIHFVNERIDAGDIIFQRPIEKTWEDTGETLYLKAQAAMVQLFTDSLPELLAGRFRRTPQDLSRGSFHLASEIDGASHIDLDKSYIARDLLNLLRARTFPGKPSCTFTENGKTYQVTIAIKAAT